MLCRAFSFFNQSRVGIIKKIVFEQSSPQINTTRARHPTRSGRAEDGVHELVVVDLDPAVTVGIELLEGLGESLDHDARAHEAVERDARRRTADCSSAGSFVNIYPDRVDQLVSCP